MAVGLFESEAGTLAPAAGPWVLVCLMGRPDADVLADLARLPQLEIFCPLVRQPYRVPRNRLSAAQRSSAIIRLRAVPLLGRHLFLRGNWWPALDIAGVGGLLADGPVPLAIPARVVARIEAYQDEAGAVPSELTPRRLLGLPAGCIITPEHEPRFHFVMSAALDQPMRTIDREILVRLVGYVCGASRGGDAA